MPYAETDLVPVGMIAVAPSVIIVRPDFPANNLTELASYAKSKGKRAEKSSSTRIHKRRPINGKRDQLSSSPASCKRTSYRRRHNQPVRRQY